MGVMPQKAERILGGSAALRAWGVEGGARKGGDKNIDGWGAAQARSMEESTTIPNFYHFCLAAFGLPFIPQKKGPKP